jgi:hypothetical protein
MRIKETVGCANVCYYGSIMCFFFILLNACVKMLCVYVCVKIRIQLATVSEKNAKASGEFVGAAIELLLYCCRNRFRLLLRADVYEARCTRVDSFRNPDSLFSHVFPPQYIYIYTKMRQKTSICYYIMIS